MNELSDLPTTRRAIGFRNEGMFFEAKVLFQQLAQADPAYPLAAYEYGCSKLLTGGPGRCSSVA